MMHPDIRQVLESRRFFKLICGASYRNRDFIARLARIYASAGAHVIDVGARPELVQAVRQGLQEATPPEGKLPLIMVSIGINQDVHFLHVAKDFERCENHGFCANACPHEVFVGSEIRLENCLGCDHCVRACPEEALTLVPRDPLAGLEATLEACLAAGATALEVHTGHGGRTELKQILKLLKGQSSQLDLLAFSLGAHGQSDTELIALAQEIVAELGTELIIQADGKPISGRKGRHSTLPSLELARALLKAQVPAYIQVSGGTNNLTGQVARETQIPIHGVGMGSFARKYLELSPSQELTPAEYTACVARARELVHSV